MQPRPGYREDTPRRVVARATEYPAKFELKRHCHLRAQLLYAFSGVLTVDTDDGAWAAPPERAVWVPPLIPHAVTMVGAVSMRSILVDPEACAARGAHCQVLTVSPLLRSLLFAAAEVPLLYDRNGRDGLVMKLLVAEVLAAPAVPFAVPFPKSEPLQKKCRAFLEAPDARATIDEWSHALGMGRRAFTRHFRAETGSSFAEWRQQACLLVALPRLVEGVAVTTVALELGYESPAAFSTMFKRLVGTAPKRAALLGGAGGLPIGSTSLAQPDRGEDGLVGRR